MGDRSDAGDEPGEHGIACGYLVDRRLERCACHGLELGWEARLIDVDAVAAHWDTFGE